jgi:hypothetical protein
MAADENSGLRVDAPLVVNYQPKDATPEDSWVSRSINESITDAMERAPMGSFYEIVYAALARRMKAVLDQDSPIGALLTQSFVPSAVNFRALNAGFFVGGGAPAPLSTPNSGAGSGSYHSRIWGTAPDERIPSTVIEPSAAAQAPYAVGQSPATANQGLLIAKIFWDLQSHLPTVLLNVTAKNYVPVGVGGSAVSKRFHKNGQTVTELCYRVNFSVDAVIVAEDDEAASNLQAIVEATFGTLRDHVENGAVIQGRTWQLVLPVRLTPSTITEIEAPWANGDDKGSKLYTTSVGLEDMTFECISWVARSVALLTADDLDAAGAFDPPSISVYGERGSFEEPIQMRLGVPQRLVVNGAPVTSDLAVSQRTKVLELRKPYQTTGTYEVIPRRIGEAVIYLYDVGMTVPVMSADLPAGRIGAPLVQRKVVVTAV